MVAIQSNDPNAIALLQNKLASLEADQERMKAANAIVRKKISENEKLTHLQGLGILTEEAYTLVNGDRMNNKGYPSWRLQNNNAEIRRVKKRIEELEAAAQSTPKEDEEYPELGLRVVRNQELYRIQLIFDEKPGEGDRTFMKSRGFKWSPTNEAWQRQLNGNGEYAAEQVIRYLRGEFK